MPPSPGACWELCQDWAGKCLGTELRSARSKAGKYWDWAGIRLGIVLVLGWGAHWDWAGKCLLWGVEHSRTGLGKSPGMSWEVCLDQTGIGLTSSLG